MFKYQGIAISDAIAQRMRGGWWLMVNETLSRMILTTKMK